MMALLYKCLNSHSITIIIQVITKSRGPGIQPPFCQMTTPLQKDGSNPVYSVSNCAQPDLLQQYSSVLQHQREAGIIGQVPNDLEDSPTTPTICHFLPHHPVVTPGKLITKVWIVYDGSAKSNARQPSLNDCLYRRPYSFRTCWKCWCDFECPELL